MLVESTLNTNLFQDDLDDKRRRRFAHEGLIAFLQKYSILKLAAADKILADCIEELPSGLRKLWQEALVTLSVHRLDGATPLPLSDIDNMESLTTNWSGKVELALQDRISAEDLGLSEDSDEFSILDEESNIEVCLFDCVGRASRVAEIESLATQSLPEGADPNQIWKARFERPLFYATHFVIFDRYAGKELLVAEDRGRLSPLEWILKRVDASSKTYVHLFTQMTEDSQRTRIENAVAEIRKRMKRGGLKDLKVSLAYEAAFRSSGHDRHLRFDHIAFNLGTGISCFTDRPLRQAYNCSLIDYQEAKARESNFHSRRVCVQRFE